MPRDLLAAPLATRPPKTARQDQETAISVSRSITAATAAISHNTAAIPIKTRMLSIPEDLDLPIISPPWSDCPSGSHYPTTRDQMGQ